MSEGRHDPVAPALERPASAPDAASGARGVTRNAAAVAWAWRRFHELSGDDVYDLLALRSTIFVVEQDCVFLDADGSDRDAWHLLGRIADGRGGRPLAAYLRCIDPGVRYPEPSIGRVVVAAASRTTGLGRALMEEGLRRSAGAWPGADIVINAQMRLSAFYRSLGFLPEGAPYDEDGIEHIAMRRAATTR